MRQLYEARVYSSLPKRCPADHQTPEVSPIVSFACVANAEASQLECRGKRGRPAKWRSPRWPRLTLQVLQERIASLELALNQLTSAQGGHPLLDKSALPGHSPSSDRGTTDWEHDIAHGAGLASGSTQEFDGTSAFYHPPRNGQHGSARGAGQDQDPSQAGPSDPKSNRFFGDASSLFLAAVSAVPHSSTPCRI